MYVEIRMKYPVTHGYVGCQAMPKSDARRCHTPHMYDIEKGIAGASYDMNMVRRESWTRRYRPLSLYSDMPSCEAAMSPRMDIYERVPVSERAMT